MIVPVLTAVFAADFANVFEFCTIAVGELVITSTVQARPSAIPSLSNIQDTRAIRITWIYGSMDLWIYGSMDLWIYGSSCAGVGDVDYLRGCLVLGY